MLALLAHGESVILLIEFGDYFEPCWSVFQLLIDVEQQRRGPVWPHDARRMRVKRHHHRRASTLVGLAFDAVENLLVSTVHAVKIAKRGNRGVPAGTLVVGKMRYVHAIRRPSYASVMPSGSDAHVSAWPRS